MALKERVVELTKNQRAIAGFTKVAVGLIIFGVAAYSDIQFILIMWRVFPDGFAKIFSLIGAVATGMSVLALVVAEAYWFSRGPQMVFGWLFTMLEVIVSVMNVILSFEMSSGGALDPFMDFWLIVVPATPFVAFVGWIIVLNLDEEQHARHEEREMQDDLAEAEREYKKAVHESKMKLKTRYLESTTTYLDQIADDPQVQAGLRLGAWKFASEELRNLTGMYIPTPQQHAGALPTGPMVDSDPTPTPPARQSVPSPAQAPEQVKPGFFDRLRGAFTPPTAPAMSNWEKHEIVQREIAAKEQDDAKKAQAAPTPQVLPTSYPYVHTPRYIDTEPLTLPAPPDLYEDLANSVAPTVPFQPAPLKENNGASHQH